RDRSARRASSDPIADDSRQAIPDRRSARSGGHRCRRVSHRAGIWAPSRSDFDARIERRRRQYRADPRFRIRAASGIWQREREPDGVRFIGNIGGLRRRWLACPQWALKIRLENSALSDVLGGGPPARREESARDDGDPPQRYFFIVE